MLLPSEDARARDDRGVKEQIGYSSLDRLISLVRRAGLRVTDSPRNTQKITSAHDALLVCPPAWATSGFSSAIDALNMNT